MFAGNSRWVSAMDWSGKESYATASSRKFLVNGVEAGVFTNSGPLTFLKVTLLFPLHCNIHNNFTSRWILIGRWRIYACVNRTSVISKSK